LQQSGARFALAQGHHEAREEKAIRKKFLTGLTGLTGFKNRPATMIRHWLSLGSNLKKICPNFLPPIFGTLWGEGSANLSAFSRLASAAQDRGTWPQLTGPLKMAILAIVESTNRTGDVS